jgi:hypothetical protein
MTRRDTGKSGAKVENRPGRRWSRAAWILFVLLAVVFFWEVLVGLGVDRRYFWDDFLEFTYPTRYFAAESLARGEIPFWNPYVFAGMPFFADIQSAVLYPLNLGLNLFAPGGQLPLVAVEALAVLHLVLAGIWMFLLVRRLGANLWGSWVSGITFMFSGFLVTHVIHLNVLEVAIWLPLSFLLFHSALTQHSPFHAMSAGAILAIAFLGGSPQISLLIYIGLGLFVLYMTGREMLKTGTFVPTWLKIPALGALAVVFSLGLCLFQLLPTYELSQLSIRPDLSYQQSVEASLPPQNLITFFMPHFFGGTAGGDFMSYWGVGRYYYFWEMCGYAGVVALLLAWIGIRNSERSYRGYFASLIVLSLLMAAGKYGGVHWLFFKILPGFDRFRIPSRALLLLVFSVSVLAGYGADVLTSGGRKSKSVWMRTLAWRWSLFSVGVLVAGVALFRFLGLGRQLSSGATVDWMYFGARAVPFALLAGAAAGVLVLRASGRFSGRTAGLVVVGLIVVDLFAFGRSHNLGTIPVEKYYAPAAITDALRPQEGEALFRVQTRAPGGVVVMRRNQGQMAGVFNIDGYNQLKLRLYQQFDVDKDLKLDLLNTRYRVVQLPDGRTSIAEVPGYLPRVFVVPEARVVGDGPEALEWMNRGDFDPRRTAVVTGPWKWEGNAPAATPASEAEIVSYSPNRIEVETRLDGRGILVFSEIHYPSWVAWVDGVRQPVLATDYALRGVPLEAGTHRIALVYESAAFRKGALLSGACLLLGVAAAVARGFGVRL